MNESRLVQHAERELRLNGLFDEDSDYGPRFGNDVLALVKLFATQRHSGTSAWKMISVLNILLNYEPLSDITNDPSEWAPVDGRVDGKPMWQNIRDCRSFSEDGGKTYRRVSEGWDKIFTAK